jgi:hypothetical protein
MNVISVHDIVGVLQQYSARYRWLDVFTFQVRELVAPTNDVAFFQLGEDHYRVGIGAQQLDLRVYRARRVARWALATAQQATNAAALTGAAIGAALGAGTRPKGPEGMILGLLLGGLVGVAVGHAAEQPNENRIMTLRYEPDIGWRVYHGPYLQWAKEALRPG